MEQKKAREVNLERKRGSFFFIGLVITSATIGMAFEYESFNADDKIAFEESNKMEDETVYEFLPEEEIPEEEPEVAPPPPIVEEPIVVDDDEIIEDIDMDFIDEIIDELPDDPVEPTFVEEKVVEVPDVEAQFPGGNEARMQWLGKNLKYPELAAEMGEQGQVMLSFVVNKDGSIEQVNVVMSVSDALDAEAKRVVKKMPKWIPGESGGKKVRSRFYLPIHFKLG